MIRRSSFYPNRRDGADAWRPSEAERHRFVLREGLPEETRGERELPLLAAFAVLLVLALASGSPEPRPAARVPAPSRAPVEARPPVHPAPAPADLGSGLRRGGIADAARFSTAAGLPLEDVLALKP